jgi:pyruvate/2-oxoglutarate dehydrogenase complex dihydrolipoamide dehydrogenase (E3) component
MDTFEAIIIGSGTAGNSLAERFSQEGRSCAIIEQGRFGGSCINYGCTPTKTLVANAKVAQSVRQGKTFGIDVDNFHIDYKAVKLRESLLTTSWSFSIEKTLKTLPHCTVFEGTGFFEGPHQVRVGDRLVEG